MWHQVVTDSLKSAVVRSVAHRWPSQWLRYECFGIIRIEFPRILDSRVSVIVADVAISIQVALVLYWSCSINQDEYSIIRTRQWGKHYFFATKSLRFIKLSISKCRKLLKQNANYNIKRVPKWVNFRLSVIIHFEYDQRDVTNILKRFLITVNLL